MPEQTFRSPNFFEREIDLSAPTPTAPTGVPGAIIGTANKGPAFVPVTVGNFDEFVSKFGSLDVKKYGPYAANEFLKNKSALTYIRVLGAGSNDTVEDIERTNSTGRVKNAGMKVLGTAAVNPTGHSGVVQFIAAQHTVSANESAMPMFSDNDTTSPTSPYLIRGMIMTPNTARIRLISSPPASLVLDQVTAATSTGKFRILISSSLGAAFSSHGVTPGYRVLEVSMNPSDTDYFAKVLNTDPDKFIQEQHLLYADFPVDAEIADVRNTKVAVLSGTLKTSSASGDSTLTMREMFGSFDTRYKTPATPWFISQPFGKVEYDLFKFEALDDGEYANTLYKVSIADVRASIDESNPFGTFTVNIRDWNDTDTNPVVLESYINCSLNPLSENYVAKLIGDYKVAYNFDMESESERRITTSGRYNNNSKYVRIVMHESVESGMTPNISLPFGFRGMQLLKTKDNFTATIPTVAESRLTAFGIAEEFSGSVLPPIPFRTKVTRGNMPVSPAWLGQPASTENISYQFHWGVKFERNNVKLNPNSAAEKNGLLVAYTKFFGLDKLDAVVTGSGADDFNDNKFTLARVALSANSVDTLTASVGQHMREAAYFRNLEPDPSDYTVNESPGLGKRCTFATLLAKLTPQEFNKYSQFTKFTTFLHGGWDGVNILDRDARRLNDKACSFDYGAGVDYKSPGFSANFAGATTENSTVISYKTAVDIATNPIITDNNVLSIPGIRETFITDYAMDKVRDYGLSYYVMDIPSYDDGGNRLFDDSVARPNVNQTIQMFDSRAIDNNYVGVYFPDVFIEDAVNRRRVKVPSSIAALGALAFNDRVAYPWFAPAGFNRAALDFVTNVGVRLNVSDRDSLYDSRINPIATFPRLGFVIYGQKTLQVSKSALDRVNVRRLMLEVKRIIIGIAQRIVFEQNTPEVRNRFVADASLQLSMIQSQAGVEAFQVVMNETNNTQADIDSNTLKGRIVVVPTRVIEYIAIDFIITNSGVQFV